MERFHINRGVRVELVETGAKGIIKNNYRNIVVIKMEDGEVIRTTIDSMIANWKLVKVRNKMILAGSIESLRSLYSKLGDVPVYDAMRLAAGLSLND